MPHDRPLRRRVLLAAFALLAAACTGGAAVTADGADAARGGSATVEGQAGGDAAASSPSWPWERAASGEHVPASVPLEEIRSGGPPPDGIPPIDAPVFEDVDAAGEWLEPRDPVLVVDLDGDARAYPLAILTYHEIVNDVVADQPLVVTYARCATPGWCSNAPSTVRCSTSGPPGACGTPTW